MQMYLVARFYDDLPSLEDRIAGARLWVAEVCVLRSRMLLGMFDIDVNLRLRSADENLDATISFVVLLEQARLRCRRLDRRIP
jgi:hypothetical protein